MKKNELHCKTCLCSARQDECVGQNHGLESRNCLVGRLVVKQLDTSQIYLFRCVNLRLLWVSDDKPWKKKLKIINKRSLTIYSHFFFGVSYEISEKWFWTSHSRKGQLKLEVLDLLWNSTHHIAWRLERTSFWDIFDILQEMLASVSFCSTRFLSSFAILVTGARLRIKLLRSGLPCLPEEGIICQTWNLLILWKSFCIRTFSKNAK